MNASAHGREPVHVRALSVVVTAIALTRAKMRVRWHLVVLWVHAWVVMGRWVLRLVVWIVSVGTIAKVGATLEGGGRIGAVTTV